MEGYDCIPDVGDGWGPTKRDIRRQRDAEDIRRHAQAMDATAPPLSEETIARVAALMSRPTPKHDLMQWRLRLFCGHVATRKAHYTHATVHGAFTGSTRCTECGLEPATIVAAEALGRVEPDPAAAPSRRSAYRTRVEKAITRHERELVRLRAELEGIPREP